MVSSDNANTGNRADSDDSRIPVTTLSPLPRNPPPLGPAGEIARRSVRWAVVSVDDDAEEDDSDIPVTDPSRAPDVAASFKGFARQATVYIGFRDSPSAFILRCGIHLWLGATSPPQ